MRFCLGRSMPEMRAIGPFLLCLSLALFVPRITAADDPDDALPQDHPAVLAHRLDATSNLHFDRPSIRFWQSL